MQINIPSDAEALVAGKAEAAGFPSVDQYVLSLILRDEKDETAPFDERPTDEEMAASLAMLDRSREDVKAGRTMPAQQALRDIAQELGLTIRR